MATGGEPTSSSQRPTRRTIAIAMFIVVVVLVGVATWIATQSATAPTTPVASGTPTSVAPRLVRHRTIVLVLQRHLVQNDLLIFRLAATHPQRSAGSASLIKGAGQPKNGSVAVVLAPVYTASTKIEQGIFSFHLHKVGHNGLAGTLNYSSPAGPNGYSNRVGLANADPITGTIIGRRVILDASSTLFHFDGLLSATQLTGTFAITDVGTTRCR